jgi:hypothetical protein
MEIAAMKQRARFQRVIEYRVAGGVGKIRKHYSVFLCEFRRSTTQKEIGSDNSYGDQRHCSSRDLAP